ncbi:GNAT family N-acetyltransferase [Tengunoibacter tsumagoiensis]|uniref:N-acetyltransferase domain-containing protein n=1 Tax=Tengunoibacter tsumagoiensis TaxID=2014871 RepID=A0A402A0W1_9CHLR|nr:hypothetical protein [Tengunoibacter tsumagoiensis]GCE12696.1 hypothetical protein KTT_25550 [Tengunoibacter tsumagoiensis]
MRIRTFRASDLPALWPIYQAATQEDGQQLHFHAEAFEAWLHQLDAENNAFVITDDDDELNTWGQGETLEGIEGEIIGYTLVETLQTSDGYHLRCHGAVSPIHRGRHAGRALLICATNRANLLASEFEWEASLQGVPVYFEALLPVKDPRSPQLAAKCELQPIRDKHEAGWQLYRRTL